MLRTTVFAAARAPCSAHLRDRAQAGLRLPGRPLLARERSVRQHLADHRRKWWQQDRERGESPVDQLLLHCSECLRATRHRSHLRSRNSKRWILDSQHQLSNNNS